MKFKFKKFSELTCAELYEIMKLRQDVFVIEQECIYPDLDDYDYDCIHAIGYSEDGDTPSAKSIISYLRILPPGKTFDTIAIGRVLVAEKERRRGVADRLLRETLAYIKEELSSPLVKLAAQQYLVDFYKSLGFSIISDGYLEDGIPHIDMEAQL